MVFASTCASILLPYNSKLFQFEARLDTCIKILNFVLLAFEMQLALGSEEAVQQNTAVLHSMPGDKEQHGESISETTFGHTEIWPVKNGAYN